MSTWKKIMIVLLLLALGCRDPQPEQQGPRYSSVPAKRHDAVFSFAVHPLHNPQKLTQAYQPLIEYLNQRLQGGRLVLEASRDYGNYEEKIRSASPHFLLPNPWQTLQAMRHGYSVIAMAGASEDFRGIFVVRKDSKLTHPADLKGKAVSYPSHTALAACIMPQYFLHQHGIRVTTDIVNRYVGSQESSIMNAYLGQTAAGATWPPPWRAFQKDHPAEAAQLKVIWETPHLLNNSVMARHDLPVEIRDQIRAALTTLQDSTEGRQILSGMETARFTPAKDADYELVRSYITRFEREVRSVEQP